MKTPLSVAAYEAFASAVGAANINADDSAVASHAWNGMGADQGANKLSAVWPSAIVMPGSTEEVQNVVKACNKHDVRFRAVSTGVFATNGPKDQCYIIVDLRRMNGMKIDPENQMAEIEPYATAGQLLAEAMKFGLTCHSVGAGPPHSPLASATAMQGMGVGGATTGINFRNLLSFEWVTPEGEVLRVGSAGCDAGWFSGEGPGPGFRGMIRGDIGTMGGLGIFTKIGYKLHPWPGPSELERTGQFPSLGMKIPEHFKVYQLAWDTWEDTAEAAIQFNKSRIANYWLRVPPNNLGWIVTVNNNEFVELAESGKLPELAREENGKAWTVMTTAASKEEADYKADVMSQILADTGGRELDLDPAHAEMLARNLVTSSYVLRAYRPCLGGLTTMGIFDSFRLLPKVMKEAEERLANGVKKGLFTSSGKEGAWSWPNEGRYLWTENAPNYDANNKDAQAEGIRYYLRLANDMQKDPMGVNGLIVGDATDLFGPKLGFANEWMRKVKNQYDPKNLSIGQHYIHPEKGPDAKVWPYVKDILFSKFGSPLLKVATDNMVKKGKN